MKKLAVFILLGMIFCHQKVYSQANEEATNTDDYWEVSVEGNIIWNIGEEPRLPHADNIEMAGQKVASIIYYTIDKDKRLSLERDIIFPQLRTYLKTTQRGWKKYRAYLRHTYTDDILPVITLNEKEIVPGLVDSVEIEGKLKFYHQPVEGLRIIRTLMPSMTERFFIEKWELQNISTETQVIEFGQTLFEQHELGIKGMYNRKVYSDAPEKISLKANERFSYAVYFAAGIDDENIDGFSAEKAESERNSFLAEVKENLVLITPDETINTLFYFSKIRAAENLFDSKMGLVHSPGGGNYYAGVWANDQAEYSGPFFPFLGYDNGNIAAYNAYKWFLKNIPTDDSTSITSSFEMEGDLTCCGLDRGDAAMIAYGASQFVLFRGDKDIATELWPLIEWCLEYSHGKKNEHGVISSTTDEMEGRISTGDANLATSSLYYGGLLIGADLAKELSKNDAAEIYIKRADDLAIAMENHFGANIEGLDTYRYFDGNTHLRHWICLPLVVGINDRKDATTNALLNKLWTENGVLVELNPGSALSDIFWDRGTLYALRGTFKAGATDLSLNKLQAFSEKRLLGDHVPYVIEAYPENDMRHLSAESALYVRIITEGLLGIEPTGFKSFTISPYLPENWDEFKIEKLKAFNSSIDINLKRSKKGIQLTIFNQGKIIFDKRVSSGKKININL
jgi:hypothetical protein